MLVAALGKEEIGDGWETKEVMCEMGKERDVGGKDEVSLPVDEGEVRTKRQEAGGQVMHSTRLDSVHDFF